MLLQLRALKSFRYGTRILSTGDEFAASRQDARVLQALRRAAQAGQPEPTRNDPPTQAPPPKNPPEQDHPEQDDEHIGDSDHDVEQTTETIPRKAKRAYKRRDMRAEG